MPSNPLQSEQKNPHPDPDSLEWHRLLGIIPQPPPSISHLRGQRILITGAGGSIGSALAQRIAPAEPASLILLDSSETALYQIDRTLRATGCSPISILGSVCDRPLLADLFSRHRPEIILHAAAYKHVPLLEQNPFAAAANNILGTQTLVETAALHRAHHLVLVSTDKAVAPHSLMGASKRIAELLCLTQSSLRTTTVRLGNVLGSQGSVVPLFLDQIAHGGPITVTHPAARRFFLALDQAVDALLESHTPTHHEAALLASNLTQQLRIVDLARYLIARHASPAQIVFTTLRPGDKLEESFLSSTERWLDHLRTPSLRMIQSPIPSSATLAADLTRMHRAIEDRNLATLLAVLQHLVPDYTPTPELLSQISQIAETHSIPEKVPTA